MKETFCKAKLICVGYDCVGIYLLKVLYKFCLPFWKLPMGIFLHTDQLFYYFYQFALFTYTKYMILSTFETFWMLLWFNLYIFCLCFNNNSNSTFKKYHLLYILRGTSSIQIFSNVFFNISHNFSSLFPRPQSISSYTHFQNPIRIIKKCAVT